MVFRPGTEAWIHDLKMDVLQQTYHNPKLINWKPSTYNISHRRTIMAIRGNTLILDAPIVQALDSKYGGCWVCKYADPQQIEQAGVEDLRIDSVYDAALHGPIKASIPCTPSRKYEDEKHAWVGVMLKNVRNGWALRVTSVHTGYGNVHTEPDSELSPWPIVRCTIRSPRTREGANTVMSRTARWAFSSIVIPAIRATIFPLPRGSPAPTPTSNVPPTNLGGTSEPHHRYAVGGLFDNVVLRGQGAFLAVNRGNSGSGHGWAGAQMVFWNCFGQGTWVMRPPDADNFRSVGRALRPEDPGRPRPVRRHAGLDQDPLSTDLHL